MRYGNSIVDDAIRFVVSEKSKDKVKDQVESSPSNCSKESKEPDYNEDEKSDKEGEEKQEQETGNNSKSSFLIIVATNFDFLQSCVKEFVIQLLL
jgi:hypothetical protein